MPIRIVIYLILVLYLVVIISRNNFDVKVDLVFKTFNFPFLAVIISSILLGVLVTLINNIKTLKKHKKQIKELKSQIDARPKK